MESFGNFLEQYYLVFIGVTAFLVLALIGYFVDKKTRKESDITPLFSKVGKGQKAPKAPKQPKAPKPPKQPKAPKEKKAKKEKGDPLKQPILPTQANQMQAGAPVSQAPLQNAPSQGDNEPMNMNMGESNSVDSL